MSAPRFVKPAQPVPGWWYVFAILVPVIGWVLTVVAIVRGQGAHAVGLLLASTVGALVAWVALIAYVTSW